MILNSKVTPSSQVESFLPNYVNENFPRFIEMMTSAFESEERVAFSQDLLQNLDRYRDFDSYKQTIVQTNYLNVNIDETVTELELVDGFGFPERDGILLIDEEIILYRVREGNICSGLHRGAAGSVELPSYRKSGEYLNTTPQNHLSGAQVQNLSSLFLVSLLKTIHETYTNGIDSELVDEQVNRSSLLQQIKDFFQSKGTKLSFKSLYKIIFGLNDTEVSYPGDLMIVPSDSTWTENVVVRSVPVSPLLSELDTLETYENPDKLIGQELELKSYNDDKIYARFVVENSVSYPLEDVFQYDINVDKDKIVGEIFANPNTYLKRDLEVPGTVTNNNRDVFTITVETTIGFPDSGVIIIEDEAIYYSNKNYNQFLNCRRGHIGVAALHTIGETVYGPFYLESKREDDGKTLVSRSFPLGLVKSVDVRDGGLYYVSDDEIKQRLPGKVDPREPILTSIVENHDGQLITQQDIEPAMGFIGNITCGVSGVYFDKRFVYIASQNIPYYKIGKFDSTDIVGQSIRTDPVVHVIPRRETIQQLDYRVKKGNSRIGMFVDGVPAISNNSPVTLKQGKIVNFNIVEGGNNYVNPTVIITPGNSDATAIVEKGRIVGIEQTTIGNYQENPQIEVTSGRGAKLDLEFDDYGRVTNVTIVEPGSYYNDIPTVLVIDETGRGRGGQLQAEVSNGQITAVNIINPGIDYASLQTSAFVKPLGEGALIAATVEFYTFDRFYEIVDNPDWTFDKGNGFLYENVNGYREIFGYVANPTELRRSLTDDGSHHSPIVGWAYDGNPIYGPYGYKNGRDNTKGVERQESGWVLNANRNNMIPSGGDVNNIGSNPPDIATYPLGTFVEDYSYFGRQSRITQELLTEPNLLGDIENLQNERYANILAESFTLDGTDGGGGAAVFDDKLDSFNGKYCNTPEYPAEIYPDGVYCYFLTVDSNNIPQFPYIIGESFKDAPMSQRVNVNNDTDIVYSTGSFEPESFDDTKVILDFAEVERFRNPYLTTKTDEIELQIGDLSKGGVSDFHFTSIAHHRNKRVGDLTYIDDSDDGNGAVGIVTNLKGEPVYSSVNNWIQTKIYSHRQKIDLSLNTFDSFTFITGSYIRTNTDAVSIVRSYEPLTKVLEVQTISPNLVLAGDEFTDNRGVLVMTPMNAIYSVGELNIEHFVITTENGEPLDDDNTELVAFNPENQTEVLYSSNTSVISFSAPTLRPDGSELKEGDLYFSATTGRMYVLYINGTQPMWICTQPLGMVPMRGASDFNWGGIEPAGNAIYHEATDNTLTISEQGPTARPDGTPLAIGDLWWSPHTGGLYVWHSDVVEYVLYSYLKDGKAPSSAMTEEWLRKNPTTREWVCTDPLGMKPFEDYASDISWPIKSNVRNVSTTGSDIVVPINIIISERAPTVNLDGDPIVEGDLWWSNANGKMYVRYNDGASEQWVVCNPSSSMSSAYSIDGIAIEGGDNIIPPGGEFPIFGGGSGFGILPELTDQELLWVQDSELLIPGNYFEVATTTESEDNEIFKLESIGVLDVRNDSINVSRGVDPDSELSGNVDLIPNLTTIRDITTSLYEVTTVDPHNLKVGDNITVYNSSIERVNGQQEIIKVGEVDKAILRAVLDVVNAGTIVQVDIIDPGRGYDKDFYVEVVGDGVGAQIRALVNTTEMGGVGEVYDVVINSPGFGFTRPPVLVATPGPGEYSKDYFAFYIEGQRDYERNRIRYTTDSEEVTSEIESIEVLSTGKDYTKLPEVKGLIKKISDRTIATPLLDGTTIEGVLITQRGQRYINPVPVFVDIAGNGSGATGDCIVEDGVIVDVNMTDGGSGYTEPVVEFVEMEDLIYCESKDIGVIQSVNVISPGRNVPTDLSLRPEVEIQQRIVIEYIDQSLGFYNPGVEIYQGTITRKTAVANVVRYDEHNKTLVIENIKGHMLEDEMIHSDTGIAANVVSAKKADASVRVRGSSPPIGRHLTDKSFASSKLAYIHDGYYYQYFSYLISSSNTNNTYDNVINDVTHPAGFAKFTETKIISNTQAKNGVVDLDVQTNIEIIEVAGYDNLNDTIVQVDINNPVTQVVRWDKRTDQKIINN